MPENLSKDDDMKFNLTILFLFIVSIFYAQDKHKIVTDDETKKPMLVGIAGIEALKDTNFSEWFNKEYNEYVINAADMECLFNDSLNCSISIVMGTWCSDSRREIPRFIKILDTLKYPINSLKVFFVDRDKKGLDNEVEDLSIKLVPTIIFYRDGKELGRITEAPEETLEKNFAKIIGCKK